ncbi:MAG: TetR/AcrR family transcriptional regulator [Byssovorax sp.]
MARPVNADAHATRGRILSSALDLFADSGMKGVTTRDVAAAARVSLAMVHHYFGSKEGLYRACLGSMHDELSGLGGELEASLLENSAAPVAILERAIRIGFQFARAHRASVRLMQREIVDAGEMDPRIREARLTPFIDQVSDALARVTGRPVIGLRLAIQSTIFLVVRYAISHDSELARLAGVPPAHASAASAAALVLIEDHLVEAGLAMLGVPHRG